MIFLSRLKEKKEKELYNKRFEQILKFAQTYRISGNDNIRNGDDEFRNTVAHQIELRDEQYTRLLTHFVNITIFRNHIKEFFKWTYYLSIIFFIAAFIYATLNLLDIFIMKASIEQLIEAIPVFITAIVGLVSVVIAIPVTITKYLFSTAEDKNITEIIGQTQKHDTDGRQWTTDSRMKEKSSKEKKNKKKDVSEDEVDEKHKIG